MAFRTPKNRERKRNQEKASKPEKKNRHNAPQEDMYRNLVENAPVVIWSAPFDSFDFTYLCPEAENIFGYPLEKCKEPGFFRTLLHPDDAEWVEEYSRLAVQEKHTYQLEYRIITKSGRERILRDIVRLTFEDGKPYQKMGVSFDISVYNQTIDELQASNRKFFMAFHNFPIPAIICRVKDSHVIDINKNFLEISGFDRNEIVGKSAFEIDVWVHPAEREQVFNMLGKKGQVDRFPALLKDAYSRERNILLSAQVFDNSGEPCVLLMFYDVTEQVRTEERLEQIYRDLETFMYKSSHNLKGPVASIKGLLYLAQKEIMDPEGKKYVELMLQCARGLENTLEELMDIARLKQGDLKVGAVDLHSMLDEISNTLKFMPEWQSVIYNVSVQQNNPFYSDPGLLYSILQNLVENGVKYRKDEEDPVIEINANVGSKVTEISVKDNGIGISEDHQGRIYEMFYRAHHKSSGSGLGLYIVKNSVEKLGGSIKLESQEGKGSVFLLSFPNFQQQKDQIK